KLTRFRYDALGNQTKVIDPLGKAVTREFDAMGRLTLESDRAGHTRVAVYDRLGRQVEGKWDGQTARTFAYDAADRPTPAATGRARPRGCSCGALGRRPRGIDVGGVPLPPRSAAAARRTLQLDSLDGAVASAYDSADQLASRTLVSGGHTLKVLQSYDGAGR